MSVVRFVGVPALLVVLSGACGGRGASPAVPEASSAAAGAAETPRADPELEALNLDFERADGSAPEGWRIGGDGYEVVVDGEAHHSGASSLKMTAAAERERNAFGVATARFPIERARGKRVTLRGHVKTDAVTEGYAGLWLRVDGEGGEMLSLDNMNDRGVTGSADWREVEIVADVPADATGVAFGAIFTGGGTAWIDGLSFAVGESEPLPSEVPVAGTVVDAVGRPVPGALVAVLPLPFGDPVALGTTDAEGRFAFTVPPAKYNLTASAPGLVVGTVVAHRFFGEDDPVFVVLGDGGVTLQGRVLDETGAPVPDARVWSGTMSNVGFGVPWVTRADETGHWQLQLPANIEVMLSIEGDGVYGEMQHSDTREPHQLDLPAIRRIPAPDDVVAELAKRSIRLDGVAARADDKDMNALRKLVGKARVVALGEATHGTREFFQLKHRMFEFLVEKLGFTVFAIEASFSHTMVVNDYVLHGKGTAKDGLDAMAFWTWHTEEVRDLIEWMRAYNADPAHRTKLKFLGFDMQDEAIAADVVAEYLGEVDPGFEDPRKVLEASADAIVERFDGNRAAWIGATSEERFANARQHAVVYGQWRSMQQGARFEIRDRSMAANARWILDREPKRGRVMLWAHNGHVGYRLASFRPMGAYLQEALGDDYRVLGFAFGDGSFQAMGGEPMQLREWTVGPPPEESFDAAFRRADCSVCVLDLRGISVRSALGRWLAVPRIGRSIGALFSGEDSMASAITWPEIYDAVIYVDRTTRARPVP